MIRNYWQLSSRINNQCWDPVISIVWPTSLCPTSNPWWGPLDERLEFIHMHNLWDRQSDICTYGYIHLEEKLADRDCYRGYIMDSLSPWNNWVKECRKFWRLLTNWILYLILTQVNLRFDKLSWKSTLKFTQKGNMASISKTIDHIV